jgi:hypothetical protein
MTLYLRFPDETTGEQAFAAAGFCVPDTVNGGSYLLAYTLDYALDIIGTIIRPGTYDPETNVELTPPETLPGWHANYIGDLPESWEQYLVQPLHPVRIFAGD